MLRPIAIVGRAAAGHSYNPVFSRSRGPYQCAQSPAWPFMPPWLPCCHSPSCKNPCHLPFLRRVAMPTTLTPSNSADSKQPEGGRSQAHVLPSPGSHFSCTCWAGVSPSYPLPSPGANTVLSLECSRSCSKRSPLPSPPEDHLLQKQPNASTAWL